MQSAIRLSAHVLAHDRRQLAGQLTGRLLGYSNPKIQTLAKQAADGKAWPWLLPLKPSLIAPGGPLIRILEGHTSFVNAVAVTPDGLHVVSGSDDNTLRVWDLAMGETKTTHQGHTSFVKAVAVTPDGRRVVSGSADNTLRVWDLATGESKTLQGHTSFVNAVAVIPDGLLEHVSPIEWDNVVLYGQYILDRKRVRQRRQRKKTAVLRSQFPERFELAFSSSIQAKSCEALIRWFK